MNKKLRCLYVVADHAIGASNAIGAGQLAALAGLTMKECASYLEILHKEDSIIRTVRRFKDRAGRDCERNGYFIDPAADLEQILSRSESISNSVGRYPRAKRQTCALAEVW